MSRGLAGQSYFLGDLLFYAEANNSDAGTPAKTEAPPAKTDAAAEGAAGGTAGGTPGAQLDTTGKPAGEGDEKSADPPEPSPTEVAIASQRKADAARMATRLGIEGDFASVEEVETELQHQQEAAHEAEQDEAVNNAHITRLRKVIANLSGLESEETDENDNTVKRRVLSDQQIQELVANEFNGLQTDIRRVERDESFNVLAAAVVDLLPEDALPAFQKAVEAGLPINQWTQAAFEHAAPHTAWGKQQAADKVAHGDKRYDEGFKAGAGAPAGTISQKDSAGRAPVIVEGKTVAEKAALMASGELDFATEAAKLGAHA